MYHKNVYHDDVAWMSDRIRTLPDERLVLKISEWAEKNRYLDSELTSIPGQYSNTNAPYAVEIMDNLCADSSIRDVVWMKASQVAATTAVLENWMGYTIDHAPAPTLYLTGSQQLSKNSVEIKLDRLISGAGLSDKIRSTSGKKKNRKTGDTATRKDFKGGFILAHGAQSVKNLKFSSVQNLAMDELEEFPASLGTQGDPTKLALVRQRGFELKRKTLYLSSPTTTDGPIYKLFLIGDQRYYFVPCKFCGKMQILEFRGKREDGKSYGIHYELDKDFVLIADSVEYYCKNCLKGWKNFDKTEFLNAGHWRPTAKSKKRLFRSYHLDGLYSPEYSYSWESMVEDWLGCWDPKTRRIFDVEALRVFQNTSRGLPYEERGEAQRFENVVRHQRGIYTRNQIPNRAALKETGSPILLLTCAVDVHGSWLAVEIKGWCKNSCSYSIDWRKLEGGESDDLQAKMWNDVRKIIEDETWTADDDKKYNIQLTLIDASYRTDSVYSFCSEYSSGVFAIMGRDMPPKSARMSQFSQYTKKGLTAYNVTVTLYKDRLAAWLKRDWNEGEDQPIGYPNYPSDYHDDYFRQYEAEEKKKKIHKQTGKILGYVWEQKPNTPNHAWDCAVYNAAALDMLVYNVNLVYLKKDEMNYKAFWEYITEQKLFYYE